MDNNLIREWIPTQKQSTGSIIKDILIYNNIDKKDWGYFLKATIKDIPRINTAYNVDKFIKRVDRAIKNKERICLYCDYDVDGMTGGSVAYLMLKELGADPYIFTNDKKKEGYGLNSISLRRLTNDMKDIYEGTSLIITIDNGISALDGINKVINDLEIDIIVTDHHESTMELPIDIVVDLKQGKDDYEFREFCGCGLIWKLLRELYIERGVEEETHKYLDLVALGTIADLVPLVGENRVLVKEGLKVMNKLERPVFNSFRMFLGAEVITEETIGFQIAPALNAQTRINGTADKSIKALLAEDNITASSLVTELIQTNDERKERTKKEEEIAKEKVIEEGLDKDKIIFMTDDCFSGGIVGLTAGRIASKYARPCIVGQELSDGRVSCSARSYGDFNLFELLNKYKDDFLYFGGHKMAAGLTFRKAKFEEIKEKLLNDEQTKEFVPVKKYEYLNEVCPAILTPTFIKQINLLAPFGMGFKKPLFKISNLQVPKDSIIYMGQNNDHIKVTFQGVNIVGWSLKEKMEEMNKDSVQSYDMLVDLSLNTFMGKTTPQATIIEDNILTK